MACSHKIVPPTAWFTLLAKHDPWTRVMRTEHKPVSHAPQSVDRDDRCCGTKKLLGINWLPEWSSREYSCGYTFRILCVPCKQQVCRIDQSRRTWAVPVSRDSCRVHCYVNQSVLFARPRTCHAGWPLSRAHYYRHRRHRNKINTFGGRRVSDHYLNVFYWPSATWWQIGLWGK